MKPSRKWIGRLTAFFLAVFLCLSAFSTSASAAVVAAGGA